MGEDRLSRDSDANPDRLCERKHRAPAFAGMSGMKNDPAPFDAAQDLADAPRTGGAQRPRDAATLILTRGGSRPEVLMGRRPPRSSDHGASIAGRAPCPTYRS